MYLLLSPSSASGHFTSYLFPPTYLSSLFIFLFSLYVSPLYLCISSICISLFVLCISPFRSNASPRFVYTYLPSFFLPFIYIFICIYVTPLFFIFSHCIHVKKPSLYLHICLLCMHVSSSSASMVINLFSCMFTFPFLSPFLPFSFLGIRRLYLASHFYHIVCFMKTICDYVFRRGHIS